MTLQEMLKDEHRAGVAEGRAEIIEQTKDEILDALSDYCKVPDSIKKRIESATDYRVLMNLYKAAITSKTLEEVEEKIK